MTEDEMPTAPPLLYVECDLPEGVTLAEWRARDRRPGAEPRRPAGRAGRARAKVARFARRRGSAA